MCKISFLTETLISLFQTLILQIGRICFVSMEPEEPEKQSMLDTETMLLSPIHAAAPRPRTVTCISAPDDSSPGSPRERDAFSVSRPRSKSVRMRNQVRDPRLNGSEFDRGVKKNFISGGHCEAREKQQYRQ